MPKKVIYLCLMLLSSILYAQQEVVDSIQKSTFLIQDGISLNTKGKYSSAVKKLKKAILLNPKIDIEKKINIYYEIGNAFQNSTDMDSAAFYYKKGNELIDNSMSNLIHYRKYYSLFNLNHAKKQVDSAMFNGLKAYDYAKLSKNNIAVSNAASVLGVFFMAQKNFKKATFYLEDALASAKQVKNDPVIFQAELYIGILAYEQKQYVVAEQKLNQVLEYFEKQQNNKAIILAKGHLSKVYFYTDRFEEAVAISFEVNESAKKLELSNVLKEMTQKLNTSIQIFKSQDSIEANFLKGQELFDDILTFTTSDEKVDLLRGFIKYFIENKKILDSITPEASKILDNRIPQTLKLQDSVYQDALKKSYMELEVEYQTEKKEKENIILKRDRDWFIFSISISIILFVSFVLYALNKRKKISLKNQLIVGEVRSKVSHGIGVQFHGKVARGLDRIATDLYSKKETAIADEMMVFKDFIRKLSHGLIQTKFLDNEFDEQFISLASELDSPDFKIKHMHLKEIPWKTINQTIKASLFAVIEEIMINAKKHANASILTLSFEKRKKKLFISAVDNGKGFDIKTANTGKGMQIIKEGIKEINGDVIINSIINKGTETKLIIQLV